MKFVLEEATDRDIRELKLEPGEQIIRVERLRMADNIPVMLENLYFPGHLKNILVENLDDTSLYQILRDKYGLVTGNSVMEIEISECNRYEASMLDIKTGTSLLLIREIVYDQFDNPLHRTKSLVRGDKFKYTHKPENQCYKKSSYEQMFVTLLALFNKCKAARHYRVQRGFLRLHIREDKMEKKSFKSKKKYL